MLHDKTAPTTLRASIDTQLAQPKTEVAELYEQWVAAKRREDQTLGEADDLRLDPARHAAAKRRNQACCKKTKRIVEKMLRKPVRSACDLAMLGDLALHYDTSMGADAGRAAGDYDGVAHIHRLLLELQRFAPGIELYGLRELENNLAHQERVAA